MYLCRNLHSFSYSKPYRTELFKFNYVASFVFTIEYILRIIAAPVQYPQKGEWMSRLTYLFSFYGIIDCVAILPFVVIYFYQESPHVHLIVLAYILIIFKLIRYSRSFQMIGSVLKVVRSELVTAYTACGIMLCFSGILMYYIECNAQPKAFANIGDGFWWAIVAFTTVGYGDIYPITPLGRILSSVISLIGIAMIAIPTGIISSAFMNMILEKKQKEEMALKEKKKRGRKRTITNYTQSLSLFMEQEIQLNEHNKQEYPPMHTCEHIVNRTMVNLFGCGRAVSAHIERKKSKLDFALPSAPSEQEIQEIEAKVNEVISQHLDITTEFITQQEAVNRFDLKRLPENASETVRIVKVGDYDECLCIGAHVQNTAEIGTFKIISHDYKEGIFRMRFKLIQG